MLFFSWPFRWLFVPFSLRIGPWCHHWLSTKAKGHNYLHNCEYSRCFQEGAVVLALGGHQGSIRMFFHGLDFSFHAPSPCFLRRSPQSSFEPIYNLNENWAQFVRIFKTRKIPPSDCPLGHIKQTRKPKQWLCHSQYREFVFASQGCSQWSRRGCTFLDE